MRTILRDLIKKYKCLIAYLIVGAITTLVNWCIYFPLYYAVGLPASLSTGISWFVAVLFAFLTNKPFVYRSNDWSLQTTIPEFFRFVSCRFISGLLEAALLFVFVDMLHMNGFLLTILAGGAVICINYIGGKILVFRRK